MSDRREDEWAVGWDDHARAQQRRIAETTTPAERLAWLEEMIALAHVSGALPRPRTSDGRTGTR